MRFETMNTPVLETACRLSSLSIVIDDFDSDKTTNKNPLDISFTMSQQLTAEMPATSTDDAHSTPSSPPSSSSTNPQKPYSRQSSDASIKKILEEAEHRKHEFWKLIDEHTAVIENLKKMEQLDSSSENICVSALAAATGATSSATSSSNQTITT